MRKLFARQLDKARRPDGSIDVEVLGELVVGAYEEAEQDRLRTDRSIGLMVAELSELQAGLESKVRRSTAELRKSRKELREHNAHLAAALENMAQGLSLFDKEQRLIVCNQQYVELYRLPKSAARPGTRFEDILRARIGANSWSGEDPENYVRGILDVADASKPSSSIVALNDGRRILVSHQPLPDGGWVSTHADVTERHNLQEQLAHLAYFDQLTDLPNRNLLLERFGEAVGRADDAGFALVFVDLRGFKAINDSLGHASGDALLRMTGERLLRAAPAGSFAGRLSGDEFAVLLQGGERAAVREVAEGLLASLQAPYPIGPQPITIAASAGVATAPADAANSAELLRKADLALHTAKRDAPGAIRFFEPARERRVQERRRMEAEIARALADEEFELHFQPVLNLRVQRFSGFEALLRWRHPVRGLVPPGEFVPLAEELGLIVPIGEWVIRRAMREAATWPSDLKVAINVSSIQLERGSVVPVVVEALAESGIAPHRVEIEITESVFLANSAQNLEMLHQLQMLGVRIALDDFGTGYSALSYLLSFPFHKIKIDGSFVRALDSAEGAHAILGAVSDIGSRMGMTTTAEGVETAEQLRKVRAMGYTEAQGFLIARPLSQAAIRQMLDGSDAMPETPFSARRSA
jgi:diguanylate cyclase (GGDEF)-like protein